MKKFKKQLLRIGTWTHDNAPNGKLEITRDLLQQIVNNFQKTPFVPLLRGHNQEEAEKNTNLVVNKNISNVRLEDDGLYADLEMEEDELSKYNDVSASIAMNYIDHETGINLGAVLNHVALVLNPYIKGLNPFIALKDRGFLIYLSDIKPMEDKDKKEEETKVEDSKKEDTEKAKAETEETEKEEKTEDQTSKDVENSETKTEKKESQTPTSEDLQKKIVELQEQINKRDVQLAEAKANDAYKVLFDQGKITPAQKDAFISIYKLQGAVINLADGKTATTGDMLVELFNKGGKVIDFEEKGKDTELGDKNAETKLEKVKVELRKAHPEMDDNKFEEWFDKNKATAKKYI